MAVAALADTDTLDSSPPTDGAQKGGIVELHPDAPLDEKKPAPTIDGMVDSAESRAQSTIRDVSKQGLVLSHKLGDQVDQIRHPDPTVDYDTGISNLDTLTGLSDAETPKETEAVLTKAYGPLGKGWGYDVSGRPYVMEGGKKVSVKPSSWVHGAASGLTSEAPIMAGMGAGAVAGAPLGPVGVVAGAGAGGLYGWLAREGIKGAYGISKKTPEEFGDAAAKTTLAGSAAEATFGASKWVGRGLLDPYGPGTILEKGFGVRSPETMARTEDALNRGLVPTIAQGAPQATFTKFKQWLTNKVFGGFPAEEKNAAILDQEFRKKLMEVGVPAAKIDQTMAEIKSLDISKGPASERLVQKVTDYVKHLADEGNASTVAADKALKESQGNVEKLLGESDPNIAERVQGAIKESRDALRTSSSSMYGKVDDLVGGKKVLQPTAIKQTIKEILDDVAKTKQGDPLFMTPEVQKSLKGLADLPDHMSFREMQQVRMGLRDAEADQSLLKGLPDRYMSMLHDAADRTFKEAEQWDSSWGEAAKALRAADNYYGENIQKFKDQAVKALVKDAGMRGSVEPEKVISRIIKPGLVDQAARIKKVVDPQTWAAIARADLDSIIKSSTDLAGNIDPKKAAAMLDKRAGMLDVVYGKEGAAAMRSFAKDLEAHAAIIRPEDAASGDMRAALQKGIAARAQLDQFMEGNYLAKLSRPGFENDQALDYILRPGHTDRIAQAKEFFHEGSPEWQDIKAHAMSKILSSGIEKGGSVSETVLSGNNLESNLTAYGRESLNEMFGKDVTNDLFELAKTIKFVGTESIGKGGKAMTGMAGGLAAMSIVLHPLSHLATIPYLYAFGKLAATPGFVRWLALGLKGDSQAVSVVREMARAASYQAAEKFGEITPNDKRKPPPQ